MAEQFVHKLFVSAFVAFNKLWDFLMFVYSFWGIRAQNLLSLLCLFFRIQFGVLELRTCYLCCVCLLVLGLGC